MNAPADRLDCACVVNGEATNIDRQGRYIQPGTVLYDPWACTWACELCGERVPDSVLQAIGAPPPLPELPPIMEEAPPLDRPTGPMKYVDL